MLGTGRGRAARSAGRWGAALAGERPESPAPAGLAWPPMVSGRQTVAATRGVSGSLQGGVGHDTEVAAQVLGCLKG